MRQQILLRKWPARTPDILRAVYARTVDAHGLVLLGILVVTVDDDFDSSDRDRCPQFAGRIILEL